MVIHAFRQYPWRNLQSEHANALDMAAKSQTRTNDPRNIVVGVKIGEVVLTFYRAVAVYQPECSFRGKEESFKLRNVGFVQAMQRDYRMRKNQMSSANPIRSAARTSVSLW